ncbi:MAG: VWA domain-containing protein [Thermoleophilia bacterium]|nr:VWA domain-containing protein [Thermoleophilia bacterium]
MRLRPIRGRGRRAIPLADAVELRAQVRRTLAVRIVLGMLAAAALAGALVVSRQARPEQTHLFGGHQSGVLVVDLSASVGITPHARIGRAFRQLVGARSSFGLVFFSDVAYEALPPGTRWTELQPLLRFFTARPSRPRDERRVPRRPRRLGNNPWSGLRGGTRISTGLALAREILRRDGVTEAGVLLVSDLDNSPFDRSALARTLADYERESVPLRVLGLSPSRDDVEFFERVVGEHALVSTPELAPRSNGREAAVRTSAAFPAALVTAAVVLLLALAANEHWSARLRWKGGPA